MIQEGDLFPLSLFNEKFEELSKTGFYQNWNGKKLSFSFSFTENKVDQEIPSDDEIKAFILTLRFFIQDNEPSSLRNLAAHYETLSIPKEMVSDFQQSRKMLNDYLKSNTNFGAEGKPLYTYKQIFESYIYGHYAHSNTDKRAQIKKWEESILTKSHSKFFFITVLYNIYIVLRKISTINAKVINFVSAS